MASERIVNGYARLFELHLLHHYWLDEGATVFDAMADAGRQRRLLDYDVRKMLERFHVEGPLVRPHQHE